MLNISTKSFSSEIEKLVKGETEPPFIESVGRLFATPGFAFPLAAFIMSISITNIVGVSFRLLEMTRQSANIIYRIINLLLSININRPSLTKSW